MAVEEQDDKTSQRTGTSVGQGDYVVQQGDCISSIALEHGHLWETILDDPANQELKRARKNHHVLLPGDRVTIPPIRQKEVNAETNKCHKFQLQGVQEVFQLCLLDLDDKPRANLQYVLTIEDMTYSGMTDGQGELKHSIPPNAQFGRLVLGTGENTEELELRLGHLDPKDAITGAQARLTNLGFDCGPVDGVLGPKTRKALQRFQKFSELKETGELDDATMRELEAKHGS